MAKNVFESANSVYVHSEWDVNTTPATYTDPHTSEVITLTYGVNAFSLVGDALLARPDAEAIFIAGGNITSLTYAAGIPIVINDGFTLGVFGATDGGTVGSTIIDFRGGTTGGIYGGGGYGARITGNVSVTISGGNARYVTGTGVVGATQGNIVNGSVDIEVTGGTVDSIYGTYAGTVAGNIVLTISDGLITGNVFAGGQAAQSAGGTHITVSGGTISNLYGGSSGPGNGLIYGGVHMEITDGYIGTVFGGGLGDGSTGAGKVNGGVEISFTGGTIGDMFGGGYNRSTVTGNVNITLGGSAYLDGDLWGGGDGSSVTGMVNITIASDAEIYGNVFAGATSWNYRVQGNANLTLAGGAVYGNVDMSTNVGGSQKIVNVTAYSFVETLSGATAVNIAHGGFLFCNTSFSNSGVLTVLANNDLSVDVDGTFYNYDSIVIDCTDFEMAEDVFQIKVLEANAWNGNRTDISITNYAHEIERPLDFRIIGTSLYLVDVASILFVNSEWIDAGSTPGFYIDPFSTTMTFLEHGRNAFASIDDGLSFASDAQLIYITGGTFYGDTYAEGTNLVINAGEFETLYGGKEFALSDEYEAANITMNAGHVQTLYGGSGIVMVGETNITISGGSVGTLFGGGVDDLNPIGDGSDKDGMTFVIIENGTVDLVYGGGIANVVETFVSFTGGTVGTIYGGSLNGVVSADSYIDLGGSEDVDTYLAGNMYAGGQSIGATTRDSYIMFYGGSIAGSVYADYNIIGDTKELSIAEGTTYVGGTIYGVSSLIFSQGAKLFVGNDWQHSGTTSLFADNSTCLDVDGTFAVTGVITVNAVGYSMGSLTSSRLISAGRFQPVDYNFQNDEKFYNAADGKRYVLTHTDIGLYVVTQQSVAFVDSTWSTPTGSPIVFTSSDGVGYYGVNAFNNVDSATGGAFTKIFVEGGTFAGAEFRGITSVINQGTFTGNVYGGIWAGSVVSAVTNLTINAGNFNGGTKKNAIAGNLVAIEGEHNVATTLTINGGTGYSIIVGANQVSAAATLTGNNRLTINMGAGNAAGIFGGNQVILANPSETLTVNGDCSTTIRSGTATSFVIGADYVTAGSIVRNSERNVLTIENGTFGNIVAGGMCFRSATGTGELNGDVALIISGGSFANNIYAGNLAANADAATRVTLDGSTTLVFNTTNNINIAGNVYAGSYGASNVTGNTNVTISGLGSKLNFTGVLSGASQGAMMDGPWEDIASYTFYVGGEKTLRFSGFTGDFNATVVCFDTIVVTGNSNVNMTSSKTLLYIASNWQFDLGSSMTWGGGANDFTGDTLDFNFDPEAWEGSTWDAFIGSATGWDMAAEVNLGGAIATWNGSDAWTTDAFQLTYESGKLTVSSIA